MEVGIEPITLLLLYVLIWLTNRLFFCRKPLLKNGYTIDCNFYILLLINKPNWIFHCIILCFRLFSFNLQCNQSPNQFVSSKIATHYYFQEFDGFHLDPFVEWNQSIWSLSNSRVKDALVFENGHHPTNKIMEQVLCLFEHGQGKFQNLPIFLGKDFSPFLLLFSGIG